jgi:hypothetical protein
MKTFDYKHMLPERGKVVVKGYDTYPRHSVLAGQVRISFLGSYLTETDAKASHPDATWGHAMTEPVNTFGHLDDSEGSW